MKQLILIFILGLSCKFLGAVELDYKKIATDELLYNPSNSLDIGSKIATIDVAKPKLDIAPLDFDLSLDLYIHFLNPKGDIDLYGVTNQTLSSDDGLPIFGINFSWFFYNKFLNKFISKYKIGLDSSIAYGSATPERLESELNSKVRRYSSIFKFGSMIDFWFDGFNDYSMGVAAGILRYDFIQATSNSFGDLASNVYAVYVGIDFRRKIWSNISGWIDYQYFYQLSEIKENNIGPGTNNFSLGLSWDI